MDNQSVPWCMECSEGVTAGSYVWKTVSKLYGETFKHATANDTGIIVSNLHVSKVCLKITNSMEESSSWVAVSSSSVLYYVTKVC